MIFDGVLNTFENEKYRKIAEMLINEKSPAYWHTVPASSSGRYHPQFALNTGGLVRHTIAVVRFLNFMLEVECVGNQYTSEQRDLLRVAAIAHDMWKSGTQEEYENSKWTKFDHPLIAAKKIYEMDEIDEDDRVFLSKVISSHMGQFNTDKRHPDIILPKPQDKYQAILHLADYLASRRDIDMKFEGIEVPVTNTEPEPLPDINTWVMPYGKHKGLTIPEIAQVDRGYIHWAKEKMEKEPAASLFRSFQM